MTYLTETQILLIHSMVVDETSGSHGLRDRGLLMGIVGAPQQEAFGKALYPTIYLKAAVYARDIIMNHPFVDGNKRTGMTAAFIFLERNGYVATAPKGAIEKQALAIIKQHLSVEEIAAWLEQNTQETQQR